MHVKGFNTPGFKGYLSTVNGGRDRCDLTTRCIHACIGKDCLFGLFPRYNFMDLLAVKRKESIDHPKHLIHGIRFEYRISFYVTEPFYLFQLLPLLQELVSTTFTRAILSVNLRSFGRDTCLVPEIVPPPFDHRYLHRFFEYIDNVTILHPCVRCKSYSCILYDSGDMLKRRKNTLSSVAEV